MLDDENGCATFRVCGDSLQIGIQFSPSMSIAIDWWVYGTIYANVPQES